MIKILLADDHTIFRSGIRRLLNDESDIQVADETGSAAEALHFATTRRYDVISLDINLENESGLDVLRSIRSASDVPVLVLSMYPEEQYALVAIRGGANGYITKDAAPQDLILALRSVAKGGTYLSARAGNIVREQRSGDDRRPPHQKLSPREYQIMLMLIKGMSLTEIGDEMLISVKTVSTHRSNILEKLGVSNNAELVLYAVRAGLIH